MTKREKTEKNKTSQKITTNWREMVQKKIEKSQKKNGEKFRKTSKKMSQKITIKRLNIEKNEEKKRKILKT